MRLLIIATAVLMSASIMAAPPSFEEFSGRIRRDHPRLFLTPETLPELRKQAKTVYRPFLDRITGKIKSLPAHPRLEFNPDAAEVVDGKLKFKQLRPQNFGIHAVRTSGGTEAMRCAVIYLATGDRTYLDLARQYLKVLTEFVAWCDRYRIVPEWYHNSRLCGLITYDWLYNELTPRERLEFMGPMLRHVDHMQNPGYPHNESDAASGNYGDPGLQFFAGLAAYGDGVDDALAEKLLKNGYKLHVDMMNLRDEISGGSGLLTTICTGYCFGYYPWATCNFLHTLKSAAGIDGTQYWTQLRDYAHWFSWAAIPSSKVREGFVDFGWGDAFHASNALSAWSMYTHMAQALHFYGRKAPESARKMRAVMAMIPPHHRTFTSVNLYPYVPFILTGFQPGIASDDTPEKVLSENLAAYFPTFGLMIMRSGVAEGDTYASIKAGAKYDQHQHYDENSFIVYKRGFQALDSGTRGVAGHHKVYYPQSVAHNTILIRMENEPLASYWYPRNGPKITGPVYSDGGQNRMAVAEPLGFEQSAYHAVTGGDATRCYSAEKCREAVRQFVYVAPDYFVIYDRVTSVKPDQQKVFLLHTQNEPQEVAPGVWRGAAGEGALFIHPVLPEATAVEVIGGPGKEFWTNGRNWEISNHEKAFSRPNWLGRYRLEISPAQDGEKARFLTVLQAADEGVPRMVAVEPLRDGDRDGVKFTTAEGRECEVWFNRDGLIGGHITIRENGRTVVDQPLLKPAPVVSPQKPEGKTPSFGANIRNNVRLDMLISGGRILPVDKGNSVNWDNPGWFEKGRGAVVQFTGGPEWRTGSCKLRSDVDGALKIKLLGPDVRDGGKRLKYFVEFTDLKVNGKAMLTVPVKVWHDAPRLVTVPVKAGEELELSVRFRNLPGGDRK